MTRPRNKTLMVCANCHDHIHTGQPTTHLTAQITGEPLRRQPARRVRREATPEKDLHHRHLAAPPTHPSKSPDGGRISIGRSTSTARSSTSSSARGEIWKPPFFTPALEHRPAPTEVTTDRAHAHPRVIEELPPAACHITEQYMNNPIEADHSRLKSRLRLMRGLKRLRSTRVISTRHAFIQTFTAAITNLPLTSTRGIGSHHAFVKLVLAV
jgi:hypothetical protein